MVEELDEPTRIPPSGGPNRDSRWWVRPGLLRRPAELGVALLGSWGTIRRDAPVAGRNRLVPLVVRIERLHLTTDEAPAQRVERSTHPPVVRSVNLSRGSARPVTSGSRSTAPVSHMEARPQHDAAISSLRTSGSRPIGSAAAGGCSRPRCLAGRHDTHEERAGGQSAHGPEEQRDQEHGRVTVGSEHRCERADRESAADRGQEPSADAYSKLGVVHGLPKTVRPVAMLHP